MSRFEGRTVVVAGAAGANAVLTNLLVTGVEIATDSGWAT
jgi:hypothetical protein